MKRFSKYMSFKIEILLIPLVQAISHIFEISEDDHHSRLLVTPQWRKSSAMGPGSRLEGPLIIHPPQKILPCQPYEFNFARTRGTHGPNIALNSATKFAGIYTYSY